MNENRPPLNGATLHMALPSISGTRGIVGYTILVETAGGWCVTYVPSLSDTSWGSGQYFPLNDKGRDDAIVSAYIRANIHLMPWAEIAAKSEAAPGHW